MSTEALINAVLSGLGLSVLPWRMVRRAVEEAENYQGLEIMEVADYPAAVALADSRSAAGDVVILSPASTSFDRFKNFEERGRAFKELVAALPE